MIWRAREKFKNTWLPDPWVTVGEGPQWNFQISSRKKGFEFSEQEPKTSVAIVRRIPTEEVVEKKLLTSDRKKNFAEKKLNLEEVRSSENIFAPNNEARNLVFVFGGFFREPVSGKLLRRRRGDRGHQRRPDRCQPRRVHLQSLLVDNGNRFRIFGNCRGSQYFDFVLDFSYVPLIDTNRFFKSSFCVYLSLLCLRQHS